jgi:hypothetical protein
MLPFGLIDGCPGRKSLHVGSVCLCGRELIVWDDLMHQNVIRPCMVHAFAVHAIVGCSTTFGKLAMDSWVCSLDRASWDAVGKCEVMEFSAYLWTR